MGNTFSNRKCCKCLLKIGDYNTDYLCLLIGKGKYNGLYYCPQCLYQKLEVNFSNTKNKYIYNNYTFDNLR
jgi:hypothetical protein